tara:strand:- start:2621 stop:2866 length:246 start_codon:yes stop_codon:yes gene_type:complete
MINLFWTFLVIHYWVEGERLSTSILFPSEEQCYSAMNRGILDDVYFELLNTYGKKIMMTCQRTPLISKQLVKPMPRPTDAD